MLLHIGNGKTVRGEEIIGIFDLDNATISHTTRAYLSSATRAGEVTYSDSDIPRAFLVTAAPHKRETACADRPGGRSLQTQAVSNHCRDGLSLQLGHARGLTPHCGVIQDPRVAVRPRPSTSHRADKNEKKDRLRHPIRKKRAKHPIPAQKILLSHVSSAALHSRCDRPIDMSEE